MSSEDEADEVDKVMRWAMDAAWLDVAAAGTAGGKAKKHADDVEEKDEKSSVRECCMFLSRPRSERTKLLSPVRVQDAAVKMLERMLQREVNSPSPGRGDCIQTKSTQPNTNLS